MDDYRYKVRFKKYNMNLKNVDTKVILGTLSVVELLSTHSLNYCMTLWILYGLYKFIERVS